MKLCKDCRHMKRKYRLDFSYTETCFIYVVGVKCIYMRELVNRCGPNAKRFEAKLFEPKKKWWRLW